MMYLAFKEAIDRNQPVGKLWMTSNGWLRDSLAQKNGRGKPDVHINVKDYLKTRYEALNCHLSQNGGFGRDYFIENEKHRREEVEDFITVINNTR
jgi:LmbE family N-acetylglucosaminyl deacetylase